MKFIADLHIHSHFSRATSRDLDPEHLFLWAQKKGITVVGTGDCTHPGWVNELQEKLIEAENGLYQLRPDLAKIVEKEVPPTCKTPIRFIISGEISCIYKREGKTRKIHHLILMPDFQSAVRLNERLDRIGNITSDGRPILGLDSRDLLGMVLEASDRSFFIPAHIWTPWFSLFGSKSGFDSIEECFGDLSSYIHALETGLSSDPPMNRRISHLDNYLLVSNSDAHSPGKLGREANLFDTRLDYEHIIKAMAGGEGFEGTIEFFPEEGKYHLDGHRKCGVRLHPEETAKLENICPACGSPLTVGVLHRVYELSDRSKPRLSKDYYCLIPLAEILSELFKCGPSTKRVIRIYEELLATLGSELHVLMDTTLKEIERVGGHLLAEAINRMRQNRVIKEEGFDGQYGIIRLFHQAEMEEMSGQILLFQSTPKKEQRRKTVLSREPKSPEMIKKGKVKEDASPSDIIIDSLNPAQKEAVVHQGSHLLIVAGPGTGKTMTLTHRIAYLIRTGQTNPDRVLALTFTNKATREMKERINRLLAKTVAEKIFISTFHGFCLDVLRNEVQRAEIPAQFTLASEMEMADIAQKVISANGSGKRKRAIFLRQLPKLKLGSVQEEMKDESLEGLQPLYRKYQKILRNLGMLDLDDLEVETLRLFIRDPATCRKYAGRYSHIFVDEYQDTSSVQVALIKTLIRSGESQICAIGDPDQAIYGFRGADIRHFYRFAADFLGAKEIVLDRNYRSTEVILQASAALMGKEKPLKGSGVKGDYIRIGRCATHSEEAEMVIEQIEKLLGGTSYFSLDSGRVSSQEGDENYGFGDIAVFFRLNAQGDALKEAFQRSGIPFVRSGEHPLTSRYPINIIWRFFQTLQYPDNDYYLNAYLDLLKGGRNKGEKNIRQYKTGGSLKDCIDQALALHKFDCSSEEALAALRRFNEIAEGFDGDLKSFLDVLALERGIDHGGLSRDRVALMSLHAAKGLEWPVVFIIGCEDELIPCSLFGKQDLAEEKRLFYVGMTRARSKLILSHASHRMINNRVLRMRPSPFISLIPENLCGVLERAGWKRKKKAHQQLDLFK